MTAKTRWLKSTVLAAAVAVAAVAQPRIAGAQSADAPAPPVPTQPAPAAAPRPLSEVLVDPNVSQNDRDEAARRLVARRTPEARQQLAEGLKNAGNPRAQQAVARALAEDPQPDPDFIIPLAALIGPDATSTAVAAQALAQYRGNEQARLRLLDAAVDAQGTLRRASRPSRVEVIRALGSLMDKRVARALVQIATNGDELAVFRAAAADALVDMTGIRENGRDGGRWAQWWAAHQNDPDERFVADLQAARAAQLDRLRPRYERLSDGLGQLLTEQYQKTPDPQKEEVLLRYLRSAMPEVRAVGARVVRADWGETRPPTPAVREQLRGMIGDSSAEVRLVVAAAVLDINDRAALPAVLAQLAQERDARVRAALADALAVTGDVAAVPALLDLLNDPSLTVAESAAGALAQLGPAIRAADPNLAATTAKRLTEALGRTGGPGTMELRQALVEAVVPLRQATLYETFRDLLRPNEPRPVRIAVLRALGELGKLDPRPEWPAELIVNQSLALQDVEPVQLEAVAALETTAGPQYANVLYRMLRDQGVSPRVRDRIWSVLVSLFPEFDKETLVSWADQFMNDPERRLTILTVLRGKLVQEKAQDDVALVQQSIGETHMKLGQYGKAAAEFRAALNYFREQGKEDQITMTLVSQMMEALLAEKQTYPDAIEFAAREIGANESQQTTLGPMVRDALERLRNDNDLNGALQLIELTGKMRPGFRPPYSDEIQRIEQDIKRRAASQNGPSSTAEEAAGWVTELPTGPLSRADDAAPARAR